MIWLPGTLSYYANKPTWERYSLKKGVVKGSATALSINKQASSSLSVSTAYTLNESTGLFTITRTSKYVNQMRSGDVYYSSVSTFGTSFSGGTYDTIYEITITDSAPHIGGDISYKSVPLTFGQIKGDLIGTVSSRNAAAYPDNGIQGNYWYVRIK